VGRNVRDEREHYLRHRLKADGWKLQAADKEETMSISRAELIDALSNMTVLELSQLIKELEDKFGVSAAAPVAMAAVAAPVAAEAAPAEEEKTEFDVVLTVCGPNKIQVIKEVRAITNLGLKEAKEAVENVPTTLKEAISKAEAEEIKKKLEEQGATLEIK
jgi:large subunit ribosomal protein L7/L12